MCPKKLKTNDSSACDERNGEVMRGMVVHRAQHNGIRQSNAAIGGVPCRQLCRPTASGGRMPRSAASHAVSFAANRVMPNRAAYVMGARARLKMNHVQIESG